MTTFILTLTLMTLSSLTFNPETAKEITSSKDLGEHVVATLSSGSTDDFISLFPTLEDFYGLMQANKSFYGKNLEDAKLDFASVYARELVPAVQEAFLKVRQDGINRGVDWKQVKFIEVQYMVQDGTTIRVTFESGKQQFQLEMSKVIVLNDNWKISQHVTLI